MAMTTEDKGCLSSFSSPAEVQLFRGGEISQPHVGQDARSKGAAAHPLCGSGEYRGTASSPRREPEGWRDLLRSGPQLCVYSSRSA